MSKYPFFGKRGRPSKEETAICKKINGLIDAGITNQEEIDAVLETEGTPSDKEGLEILYTYLSGESTDGEKGTLDSSSKKSNSDGDSGGSSQDNHTQQDDFDTDDDVTVEDDDYSHADGGGSSNGIGKEAIDFDPFDEKVIDRGYTKGISSIRDDVLDEEDFDRPSGETESVADDVGAGAHDGHPHDAGSGDGGGDIPHQDFEEEDIPEPDYVAGGHDNYDDDDAGEFDIDDEELDDNDGKLGGDNLEDMSPAQKRKSAEKTADALLEMYGNFAPLPFKKWASISESKVQKMVFNNQLDTSMPIENGVTVQDYIDGVNEQVSEVFTVDNDTKESIREPLIEVLLEQEIALTPTQRLMMAVGSHLATMGMSAFQLAQNNKQALETFKQFHAERNGSNSRASQSSSSSGSSSQRQSSHDRPSYSDDFGEHDKEAVEKMMREMESEGKKNGSSDDVIDADSDESITVEETTED